MIKLYASGTARSRRVQWACEEVGAPYERVELKWPSAENPGYLEINPAGTVPAIVDGDVRLTDSVAAYRDRLMARPAWKRAYRGA
jgi:glutathione S-transferase